MIFKGRQLGVVVGAWMFAVGAAADTAVPAINDITLVPRLTVRSTPAVTDEIQYNTDLGLTNWVALTNWVVSATPYWFVDVNAPPSPRRFYRVVSTSTNSVAPNAMALIPAGSFTMGDNLDGEVDARPTHTVTLSAFYMDVNLVTFGLWKEVHDWATDHGYAFDNPGMGKAENHPVHTVNWYDAVKWCNARSEMEGLAPSYFTSANQTTVYRTGRSNLGNSSVNWTGPGYRLPTEAEWEKAARGDVSGHRFPWSDVDTINHSRANYPADPSAFPFDLSATTGNDAAFNDGAEPYTSPVGYFAPNGYGLYDMAGNIYKWCWDSYAPYSAAAQSDPKSPSVGTDRIARGASWCCSSADSCRNAYRFHGGFAGDSGFGLGFRSVRSAVQ